MEKGTVRAVSFKPSTATQERYNNIAESKSPVKITNFETDNKRKGHPVDVIIRKRTRIDELSEALPFTRRDIFASKGKTTSIERCTSWPITISLSIGNQSECYHCSEKKKHRREPYCKRMPINRPNRLYKVSPLAVIC